MSRVPLLDYAFLAFESEESPKHVAGLQIFNRPKNAPSDFVTKLVAKIKSTAPTAPFDQKLHTPLVGLPVWKVDQYLDLDAHIHYEVLPSPHTEKLLLDRVAVLHAKQLDRDRPLWQLYFFDHYKRNSFAMFFKVHHAYMDGISLSKRALIALSDNPDCAQSGSFWGENAGQQHESDRSGTLINSAKSAVDAMFVLPSLAKLGLKHGLRFARLSGRELPLPFTAPRTAFNRPLTPERSVAIKSVSLRRVHSIARHAGVTINDVILELCDSAMTQYLADHHEIPARPLVAQMPISLRRSEGGQGNQISIALLELGSREKNPVARLQRIHTHARHAKDEFNNMSVLAAEVYTLLLQGVAQFSETSGLGGLLPPLGNVVVSNIIGPSGKLYLEGAPLRAVYPISTIAPGLALNVTTYSYNNTLFLGIVAGKSAIADLSPLVQYLESSLVALEKSMGLKKKKPVKTTPGKRKRSVRKTRKTSED